MPATPTLGCQIAPIYEHDPLTDSGNSSSEDEDEITETETEERERREEAVDPTDLEKAETQRDCAMTGTTTTRPDILQKGRTKSNRRAREEPQLPVGFWHWQMVGLMALYFDSAH